MANNHSAEFCRGAVAALQRKPYSAYTTSILLTEYQSLLADAEAREAGEPTAAEVIAEFHGCLDTIKHLSAEIGADSGDIAVHGVALLGLAKIDHWKEANGGK